MKYLILTIYFILSSFLAIGQSGSLDPTFGNMGYVITELENNYNRIHSTAIQNDGKIITVGSTQQWAYNDFEADFAIVRYHIDGAIDLDFGNNGIVLTDLNNFSSDVATDVAIQEDGKIVVSGLSHLGNIFEDYSMATVRYNSDGTLDESFGSSGIVLSPINSEDDYSYAVSQVIQPDGKILVTGSTINLIYDVFLTIRYNSNGTLDSSFGSNGKVETSLGESFNSNPNAIAIQSDGKILIGGVAVGPTSYPTWADFGLIRLEPDGSLDTNFGNNGIVITPLVSGFNVEYIEDLAIQNDGKIIAIGNTDEFEQQRIGVVRYNIDGSLDDNFGTSGVVLTQINSSNTQGQTVALTDNENIIVGGYTGDDENEIIDIALVQYSPIGNLDNDFGDEGIVITDINTIDVIADLNIQADGKILASGFTGDSDQFDFLALRYMVNITGLAPLYEYNFVKVFPNPVTDVLNVEIPKIIADNFIISILNLYGKKVWEESIDHSELVCINISGLKTGLYILQLESDQKFYAHKILKE